MRYKNLILDKLEDIDNKLSVVQSLLSQGASRTVITEWFEAVKAQIENTRTLLNTEKQD